ncbi:hypothetical protein GIB67_022690 [Kingdonia uniflora]|uniref:BZIP domain-containing protein n=1 Tax=Kingdonia uniflora TaxID=39325 RepID=A0A7J7P926_9MAGN|nr:hypothetical protein GIB67_022690 [Kingdonia uniflora]
MGNPLIASPNSVQSPHFTFHDVPNKLGQSNPYKQFNNMNLDEFLDQKIGKVDTSSENAPSPGSMSTASSSMNPQPTPTTLEEFLIRSAGIDMNQDQNQEVVVTNQQPLMVDAMGHVSQTDWMQYQMAAMQQEQMEVYGSCLQVGGSLFTDDKPLSLPAPMQMVATNLSGSQTVVERKRRFSDEVMEKTIERRQKRMIKNRESAARSRARKQRLQNETLTRLFRNNVKAENSGTLAHINQLEEEVSELRKINARLLKQQCPRCLCAAPPPGSPTPASPSSESPPPSSPVV